MAGTALVHIGTRKTGTSSLQAALAQAQACDGLGGVLYPMTDVDRHHAQLVNVYLPYDRLPRSARATLMAGKEHFDALRRSYAETLNEQLRTTHSAVISSEHLSLLSSDEVQRFRNDLDVAGFRDFRVILYVRDPADYYLSQTQQILKASSRIPDPASFRYAFREIITSWETVFPGQLTVRHNGVSQGSTSLRTSPKSSGSTSGFPCHRPRAASM